MREGIRSPEFWETLPGFLFCYAFAPPVKTGGYFQNVPPGHFVASNFIRL